MEVFTKALASFCARAESEVASASNDQLFGSLFPAPARKRARLCPRELARTPSLDYAVAEAHLSDGDRSFIDAFTVAWHTVDDRREVLAAVHDALAQHYDSLPVLDRLLFTCLHIIRSQVTTAPTDHGTGGSGRGTTTPQSTVTFLSPGSLGSPVPGSVGTPHLARAGSFHAASPHPIHHLSHPPTLFTSPVPATIGLASATAGTASTPGRGHPTHPPALTSSPVASDHALRVKYEAVATFVSGLFRLVTLDRPALWLAVLHFVTTTLEYVAGALLDPAEKYVFTALVDCPALLRRLFRQLDAELPRRHLGPLDRRLLQSVQSTVETLAYGRATVRPFACPQVSLYELAITALSISDPTRDPHWGLLTFTQLGAARRTRLAPCLLPPRTGDPDGFRYADHPGYTFVAPELERGAGDAGDLAASAATMAHLLARRAHPSRIAQWLDECPAGVPGRLLIRRLLFRRIRDVLDYLDRHSNFDDPLPNYQEILFQGNGQFPAKLPRNLALWPLMAELADQVYALAHYRLVDFDGLFDDAYGYLFPSDRAPVREPRTGDDPEDAMGNNNLNSNDDDEGVTTAREGGRRDNGYLWILLQLTNYDDALGKRLSQDFSHTEDYLAKMSRMFNEHQIVSWDGFYLRDTALQCIVYGQQSVLSDRSNLKYRHPSLTAAMPYFSVLNQIQNEVHARIQELGGNDVPITAAQLDILADLDDEAATKVAVFTQARHQFVLVALYRILLPAANQAPWASAVFPSLRYTVSGRLSHRLLELLPVSVVDRVATNLVHYGFGRMRAPQYPANQCFSPPALDTLYRLLLVNPLATRPVLLRLVKNLTDADRAVGASAESGPTPRDSSTLGAYYTTQLLAHRLATALRDHTTPHRLLHCVRWAVERTGIRQYALAAESLAVQLLQLPYDGRLLDEGLAPDLFSVSGGARDTDLTTAWFPANELLARRLVLAVARVLKGHQYGTRFPRSAVYALLDRIGAGPRLVWSRHVLAYFPAVVRAYYVAAYGRGSADPTDADRPGTPTRLSTSPTEEQVNQLISQDDLHNVLLFSGDGSRGEGATALAAFYAAPRHQPLFLCVLWTISEVQGEVPAAIVGSVRRIMRLFPPAHLAAYTAALVDFVLGKRSEDSPSPLPGRLFEDLVWKYQLLTLDHVTVALLRGHQGALAGAKARRILRHLLFASTPLSDRLTHWRTQNFAPRPWIDPDHYTRVGRYLNKYPEFFDFEAFGASTYAALTELTTLDPPHAAPLPVLYETHVLRLVQNLDYLLARAVEWEDRDLLLELLGAFADLVRTHYAAPLSLLHHILHYYYDSPVLRDSAVLRALLTLVDLKRYPFTSALTRFANPADNADPHALVSPVWVTELLTLAIQVAHPLAADPTLHATLPPVVYREDSDPVRGAAAAASVELLVFTLALERAVPDANPVPTLLLAALLRPSAVPLPAGITPEDLRDLVEPLFAHLPSHAFTRPLVSSVVRAARGTDEPEPRTDVSPSYPLPTFLVSNGNEDTAADATLGGGAPDPWSVTSTAVFNPDPTSVAHFLGNGPHAALTLFHAVARHAELETFYFLHIVLRGARSSTTAAAAATVRFTYVPSSADASLGAGDGGPAISGDGIAVPTSTTGQPLPTAGAMVPPPYGLAYPNPAVATPHTPSMAIPATPSRILQSLAPSPATGSMSSFPLTPQRPVVTTPVRLSGAGFAPVTVTTPGTIATPILAAATGGSTNADPAPTDPLDDYQLLDYRQDGAMSGTVGLTSPADAVGPLTSDTQLLYILAILGPHLHRLDSEPRLFQSLLGDLLWLLVDIHPTLPLFGLHSTVAMETILDFFFHARRHFHADQPALWRDFEPIIAQCRDPIKARLLPICLDRPTS
ncbi:hypothetical protein IWQ60_000290 [Tieghemiomyces parasiticus]|uniref:Mediator complex subunit 23-domain-containing protein n=1 Tax=Tieghemiomyces parasiticus TaxID=78921 RepID=A0A9W8ALX5_9FUNG|nr:hypothetical protein IWQ60_000290 [Tieghemiomyces parasiticus]